MQAFWVIQPRRNNPIIQLEKAVLDRFYLSAEEAKEALADLQKEDWTDTELNEFNFQNFEVVGLVADWPPSQFKQEPKEDKKWQAISLDDVIEDLWSTTDEQGQGPEAEPETPPEPSWLLAVRELSPLAAEWNVEEAEALGSVLLATALTAHEGQMTLTMCIKEAQITIAPGKSPQSMATVTANV